ncbi:MAG: DEAD/DEAH box helicase family protein [Symplocastrum torsivum CPER-KK1]|uniref:DEAD/DEAH box helicase family protein n=1 Tax=Symplocastrum torsivum CPER-KK1 TaxID=450513 RepID=A0A951UB86_9CYAN|nr:DEAD/DEAH box helicase family protein [Symplocastrum torsivum CPER-KK1]
MMRSDDNYFIKYHSLVLHRILQGQTELYPHQQQALLAIYQKACRGEMDGHHREAALILAGVGTGKTLMQAITPFILAPWMLGKTALFLSDNCTLRSRFLRDFPTDHKHRPLYDQWPLYQLKILPPGVPPPKIVELDASDFNSYAYCLDTADMLVGNRQFLVNLVSRGDIEPNSVGVLITDEAHFSAANSYRTICNYFEFALLTYFTGSKFRSDAQPLPHVRYTQVEELDALGRSVLKYAPVADYEFTLQEAWSLEPPPIKKLMYKEATSTAFLVEEAGSETEYSFEEFLNKAETDKQWFRQILFADSFSIPVLEMAVDILLRKRERTGQPQAMLVRALNIPHTHRVAKLLEENFPVLEGRVGVIHSEHDSYDLAGRPSSILSRFYNGDYWVIVHCGLVGVGFDHKWISVSCCLCILKSMSPAEQEWGRALRRVPGEAPGNFPQLTHPNWGVVVTHAALGLRELFGKFQQGVTSDVIREDVVRERVRPLLTTEYEAGETILNLSDTSTVKPGDVLQLRVPVGAKEEVSPKFSIVEELRSTGNLSEGNGKSPRVSESGGSYGVDEDITPKNFGETQREEQDSPPLAGDVTDEKSTPLPWQQEADAISEKLSQIRSIRTYSIQVEAVLDERSVQITPAWNDFPKGVGVDVSKSREVRELSPANFLSHIGLDWQILVGEELISYRDYSRRVVLQKRGFDLDDEGEILVGGVRLKDTMPSSAYELFLKGLEAELATEVVEVPHPEAVARPDKAKMETQARYGAQVRSLINNLFNAKHLIPDGTNGCSLVERPTQLLRDAKARVEAKGHEPDFRSNSALVHAAVFGFIKEKTGRSWSEHTTEQQYLEAMKLARQFMRRLAEQLQWRRR